MKLDFWNKKKEVQQVRTFKGEDEDTLTDAEIKMQNVIRSLHAQINKGDIDGGIDEIVGNDYRAITISDMLQAIRQADQPWDHGYQSSWIELFDIFANLELDAHLQGAIDTLDEGLQSKPFDIVDAAGNKLDDITRLFKSEWFSDYMTAYLNTRLWGFGLIKLKNFNPADMSLEVQEVNRKHVRPDLGGLTRQQYDQKVWRYWDKKPWSTWNIYVYHDRLGKLTPCVRWYIYKNEIVRFWARYNQSYGVPRVMAKTNIKDTKRRENAISMVKNWIKTNFLVVDNDDTVETINPASGSGGQEFFEKLIRLADEQMSKALLGSTMVLDSGSSLSQSEVHAENTAKFVESTARKIMYSVNKELIPRLREIGMPIPQDAYFKWDESENLTMLEKAQVLSTIGMTHKVTGETATNFIGIDIEEREEPLSEPNQQIQNFINKKYTK